MKTFEFNKNCNLERIVRNLLIIKVDRKVEKLYFVFCALCSFNDLIQTN